MPRLIKLTLKESMRLFLMFDQKLAASDFVELKTANILNSLLNFSYADLYINHYSK
jgi:hypothetical protein